MIVIEKYAGLIKFILAIIILIAVISISFTIYGWKKASEVNAETVEVQDATMDATSDISNALNDQQGVLEQVVSSTATRRNRYVQDRNQLVSSDPNAAAWRSGVIPLSVRKLACSRRESCDGLGGDVSGSESDGEASSAGW